MIYYSSSIPRYRRPPNFIYHQSFKQSGFSFLELLISLVIFAVGFLGLAALQSLSFKMMHDSVMQASAVSISNSIIDQLRVKKDTFDISPWSQLVSNEFPNGNLELNYTGSEYHLKLQWQESSDSGSLSTEQNYELTFSLNY